MGTECDGYKVTQLYCFIGNAKQGAGARTSSGASSSQLPQFLAMYILIAPASYPLVIVCITGCCSLQNETIIYEFWCVEILVLGTAGAGSLVAALPDL